LKRVVHKQWLRTLSCSGSEEKILLVALVDLITFSANKVHVFLVNKNMSFDIFEDGYYK